MGASSATVGTFRVISTIMMFGLLPLLLERSTEVAGNEAGERERGSKDKKKACGKTGAEDSGVHDQRLKGAASWVETLN